MQSQKLSAGSLYLLPKKSQAQFTLVWLKAIASMSFMLCVLIKALYFSYCCGYIPPHSSATTFKHSR